MACSALTYPFSLRGLFAAVEGRGEIVTPLNANTPNIILLVKPDLSVSTKWAYSAINRSLRLETGLLPELTKKENNIKLFSQAPRYAGF